MSKILSWVHRRRKKAPSQPESATPTRVSVEAKSTQGLHTQTHDHFSALHTQEGDDFFTPESIARYHPFLTETSDWTPVFVPDMLHEREPDSPTNRNTQKHTEQKEPAKIQSDEPAFTSVGFEGTLVCGMCRSLLLEPIQLDCFHVFCCRCIENRGLWSACCPWCRVPLPIGAQVESLPRREDLQEQIAQLVQMHRRMIHVFELDMLSTILVNNDYAVLCGVYLDAQILWKQAREGAQQDEKTERIVSVIKESILMKSLQHENIITCRGFTLEPCGLVMEYLPLTLSELIHQRPIKHLPELPQFDDLAKFKILAGICQGLYYLHTLGMIHGNISSTSMFVDASFHAKIGDFGRAFLPIENVGTTQIHHQHIYGDLCYMDPNYVREYTSTGIVPLQVPGNDIYSFGVVCWEVLSEAVPYGGIDLAIVFSRKLLCKVGEDELGMRRVREEYPSFAGQVRRCLSIEQSERLSSQELTGVFQDAAIDPYGLKRISVYLLCHPNTSESTESISVQKVELDPKSVNLSDITSMIAALNNFPLHPTHEAPLESERKDGMDLSVRAVLGFHLPDPRSFGTLTHDFGLMSDTIVSGDLSKRSHYVRSSKTSLRRGLKTSPDLIHGSLVTAFPLPRHGICISIHFGQNMFAVNIHPTDLVDSLRAAVWINLGVEPHRQVLVASGKQMVGFHRVESYSLESGSLVTLSIADSES